MNKKKNVLIAIFVLVATSAGTSLQAGSFVSKAAKKFTKNLDELASVRLSVATPSVEAGASTAALQLKLTEAAAKKAGKLASGESFNTKVYVVESGKLPGIMDAKIVKTDAGGFTVTPVQKSPTIRQRFMGKPGERVYGFEVVQPNVVQPKTVELAAKPGVFGASKKPMLEPTAPGLHDVKGLSPEDLARVESGKAIRKDITFSTPDRPKLSVRASIKKEPEGATIIEAPDRTALTNVKEFFIGRKGQGVPAFKVTSTGKAGEEVLEEATVTISAKPSLKQRLTRKPQAVEPEGLSRVDESFEIVEAPAPEPWVSPTLPPKPVPGLPVAHNVEYVWPAQTGEVATGVPAPVQVVEKVSVGIPIKEVASGPISKKQAAAALGATAAIAGGAVAVGVAAGQGSSAGSSYGSDEGYEEYVGE